MANVSSLRLYFNRQSGMCIYCHHTMTLEKDRMNSVTKDHIVPRSVGGLTTSFNTVASCYRCNQIKASLSLSDFFSSYSPHKFPVARGPAKGSNAWRVSNINMPPECV